MSVTPEDLARTLLARERSRREHNARRAEQLRRALSSWAAAAKASGLVGRAWMLGSLARGDWGDASDVDIAVEGLAPNCEASTWSGLEALLSSSVDLLRVESLPRPFAERIRAEGIELP